MRDNYFFVTQYGSNIIKFEATFSDVYSPGGWMKWKFHLDLINGSETRESSINSE